MKVRLDINVGDTVWFMYNDQVASGIIKEVIYRKWISTIDYETINTTEIFTVSLTDNGGKNVTCRKDDLFPDKKSLINSL